MTTTKTKRAMISDYYPSGQCRMTLSGSNLLLAPCNGNQLVINSVVCSIPDAGITLAPPATTTLYYIYAYMSGATMTLEASTTTHAKQAGTGVEIKSGDATRTLVGMAMTLASVWVDNASYRYVLSYFNRRQCFCWGGIGNTSTASTTAVDLTSARYNMLNWADEIVTGTVFGQINTTGAYVVIFVDIDGATQLAAAVIGSYANANYVPSFSIHPGQPAEGTHSYGMGGWTNAGTAYYLNTIISVMTMG